MGHDHIKTPEDTPFATCVRTTPTCPFDKCIATIEAAIDALIHCLPEPKQTLPHWQRAHYHLYSAFGPPKDVTKLDAAEAAFRDALKAEQWLRANPPTI
jgi:hypothetical protein